MGDALLDLGDRYWALGLPAAARSAFARVMATTSDAAPALRLADVALAQGDWQRARAHAAEAAKRAAVPSTRILLGRAQFAAGELDAARRSIALALDAPRLSPWDRARAHLELARIAAASGDASGAAAQAAAAFDAALTAAQKPPFEGVDYGFLEEIAALVVAHGRDKDATEALDASSGSAGLRACAAALLAARQAAGDSTVSDAMIDAELTAAEAEAGPDHRAVRLRRLERRVRMPNHADRPQLVAEIEGLIQAASGDDIPASERARLCFLRAALYEEDPQSRDRAEDAYRRGLVFQPGHASAACRLALILLERGDQAGALSEIERALRVDARYGLAWRNAARILDASSLSLSAVVAKLLDAASPGAGSAAGMVAPRLVAATAEVARQDVLAGVYAHGHRVKNLLGIIGARTRSARKLAGEGVLLERLRELEHEVTALYEEWAQYLRSMQAPTPTIELVSLSPLLLEVVAAAQARTPHVPIALDQSPGLPDVRGDRMLLREALLNIVSNAAEACGAGPRGGDVVVQARVAGTPGVAPPLVEIVVSDTGPGIPRSHLGRLFVPGFTTKETGSGVGLAIAERAVSAHHGRISVDSEEGRGTTIVITLPTDNRGLAALPRWMSAERP